MPEIPFEVGGHRWTEYRHAGASRHEMPADICITCSDEEAGRLVPISFCPVFAPLVEAEYRALFGEAAPKKYLRGDERKAAADEVCGAILECIHTLTILDVFRHEPPEGYEKVEVPFADNIQRALEKIEPLRSRMTQLLYDLPGDPHELYVRDWKPAP